MLDVDEAFLGVQEADVGLATVAQRVVDLLAVQQGAQHAQVFAELARLHRVLAHDAHGGVARADAEEGAPGASLLMVAIEWAVTGASRTPATDTPVPRRMREVLTAASASVA